MAFNVLIVDDSAVMRALLARLVRQSGVPVAALFEAADGEAGLRATRDCWIDLVLLDVHMPGMDGEEMLRRLRADPASDALPVIVVSSDACGDRVRALEALGASFVHKPFAPETLRDVILRVTGVTPDDEYYAAPAADGAGRDR